MGSLRRTTLDERFLDGPLDAPTPFANSSSILVRMVSTGFLAPRFGESSRICPCLPDATACWT